MDTAAIRDLGVRAAFRFGSEGLRSDALRMALNEAAVTLGLDETEEFEFFAAAQAATVCLGGAPEGEDERVLVLL